MSRLFNGAGDHITSAAPLVAIPLTMSCWFNKPTFSTLALLSLGVVGGVSRAQLDTRISGSVGAVLVNAAGTSGPSLTGSYSSGVWTHVAGTFETTTSRTGYFNGTAGTPETTNLVLATPDDLQIGARYSTTLGAFTDAMIAEVGIWNVVLTAAEIASLALGYSPKLIRPQSLVFYSDCIRNVFDFKGLTLTPTGTTITDHPRIFQ